MACNPHRLIKKGKEVEGGERLFLIASSLGISELFNGTIYQCKKCHRNYQKSLGGFVEVT